MKCVHFILSILRQGCFLSDGLTSRRNTISRWIKKNVPLLVFTLWMFMITAFLAEWNIDYSTIQCNQIIYNLSLFLRLWNNQNVFLFYVFFSPVSTLALISSFLRSQFLKPWISLFRPLLLTPPWSQTKNSLQKHFVNFSNVVMPPSAALLIASFSQLLSMLLNPIQTPR